LPSTLPDFLEWMEGADSFIIFKRTPEKATNAVLNAEAILCIDLNQLDRLESLGEAVRANSKAVRIVIDHHPNPSDEYDIVISHPEASSTAYIVYWLIGMLSNGEDLIDKSVAEALYVGIMTDTGNFSFSNLTPDLFRTVAFLVEKGVNVPAVNNAVYSNFSHKRISLLGYSLYSKMIVLSAYGAAYLSLEERELRRFGFKMGDSEGFVNYPLTIRGINMSAIFIGTNKFIRVSLRSRGDIDVNRFASKYFNGGGHKNAAGGKSFVSMEQTIEHYCKALEHEAKK